MMIEGKTPRLERGSPFKTYFTCPVLIFSFHKIQVLYGIVVVNKIRKVDLKSDSFRVLTTSRMEGGNAMVS
jgi:hypothetical protein